MASGTNPLLLKLQLAMAEGRAVEAAAVAYQLAQEKTDCLVTENVFNEQIQLMITVEQNERYVQTLNVEVRPSDTLLDLKNKIHKDYNYHPISQQWIINNKLVKIDETTLSSCGINPSKRADVFLTLIEKKPAVVDDPPNNSIAGIELNSKLRGVLDSLVGFINQEKPTRPTSTVPTIRGWVCGTCTFVNKPGRPGCEICSNPPPEKKPRKVSTKAGETRIQGWKCGNCTFVNQPTRPGCELCADPRPEGYRVPDGYVRTPEELERLRKEKENERAMKEAELKMEELAKTNALKRYRRYLSLDDSNLIRNEEELECPVCFERIRVGEGVILRDCAHSFCPTCLRGTINTCDDAAIGCPAGNCFSFLLDREIKELVPNATYQQYLQRSINVAEVSMKDSFHCLTPDCRGWCVFEVGVNTFPCPVCRASNCMTCRIIHSPLTCKQYQDDLKLRAQTEVDAKRTLEQVQVMIANNEAINCPGCGVVIMKTSGCAHIKCTYCKLDSNWPQLKNT